MVAISDSLQENSAAVRLAAAADALLPPQYDSAGDPASPRSMGSASLVCGADGRVAWNEIWTSFCDLALAGGPPHRGTLLDAPTPEEVANDPAGHHLVAEEIARGIRMASGLPADPAGSGWVSVSCMGDGMASWLLRAVMAENVFVQRRGDTLLVPAGPRFRLAREVKNVVVAVTKATHYWSSHMSPQRQETAAEMLRIWDTTLLAPASWPEIVTRANDYRACAERLALAAGEATACPAMPNTHPGWAGIRFHDEWATAWFVRSAIVANILARREIDVLYLPVPDPVGKDVGFEVVDRLESIARIWEKSRSSRPGDSP